MRQLFLIISLLFCLNFNAQELSVKSFEERTNDLSARKYSRMDNNDVPCALVKVQLASSGAVFEGAVMGGVDYKTSEYWVYMPKGSRRLTVKLEGYLPLPYEFPQPLESNVTYVLTISGVIVRGQQQEVRTKTGWIIIDSEPQGAAVYINNEFVGNTPLDSYKQPYGTYNYRLDMQNYHSAEGVVELNSAKFDKKVTMSPAFGSIAIKVDVEGANVLLDGKTTNKKTPCTLTEIPSGTHVIALQKEKYAPMQYNVLVEDGKETPVSGNLDARFASITINTMQGAEIFIDNTRKGTTSFTSDLMEGYYDVEARLAHHKPATKQVQVVAKQPQTITIDPKPIYGSLDIISTPRKADITIDGKLVGQTPFTVEQLLEGSHTVTITMGGYAPETKKVTIEENQTSKISATLSKNFKKTIEYVNVDGTKVKNTTAGSFNNGHELVDLGLSVKWATCNVGATTPEDYGDSFAWGETSAKSTYTWSTYKWCKGSSGTITKYCTDSNYGTVDNKTTLDLEDDAAHVNWGGNWRMPTDVEQNELRNNCFWTWTTLNGVKGYKVTSKKNGNSIFLPAAGYRYNSDLYGAGSDGDFWSSSLNASYSYYACYLGFYYGPVNWNNGNRYSGRFVRAVCP